MTAAGLGRASDIYKSIDTNGNVVYSDHPDSTLSKSTAVRLGDPPMPPHELHFCWTNCFTLILDNGVYRRKDGTDESWTVEAFSARALVLHRHDAPADWNNYSRDVVYAGEVANDRLIGVTVNGVPVSGIDASWGTALATLPGSNAERDSGNSAKIDSSSGAIVSSAATPPPLPGEEQPAAPQDGLLWTPGYWFWRDRGYVWIPGAWVRPPRLGLLWTPPYWGIAGNTFVFHPGHWGSAVGFYGGVNYGHGYFGSGYSGGHWIGNSFAYNSAVNHRNAAVVHQTYGEPVASEVSRGIVSYAGGPRVGAAAGRTPPVDKPAAADNAPTSSAPSKAHHGTPTRAPAAIKSK